MSKRVPLAAFMLVATVLLTACAHQRQPRAKCTGPLELINMTTPEEYDADRADVSAESHDELPQEESEP